MIRIFKHYIPGPLLFLGAVEILLLFFSFYVGIELRFLSESAKDFAKDLESIGPIYPRAIILTLVMLGIMISLGVYQRDIREEGDWTYYSRFVASFIIGFIVMTFIFYAIPELHIGRGILGISFLVSFTGTAIARFVFLLVVDSDVLKRRVVVLGTGSRASRIAALYKAKDRQNRFLLVGFIPMGGDKSSVNDSLILKDKIPLLAMMQKYEIGEIIVGVRQRRGGGLPMGELLECRMEGINIVELSTFFEKETGKIQLEMLNPSWIIFSDGFDRGNTRNIVKRVFDISISLLLVLLTLPILIITAILIKLESRGPIFYKQIRIGECGKPFKVYKFRSMKTDAEKKGKPQWAIKNDARVTRVGKIIRLARIDELPQIINVLNGDMSFVGPRPERPYFVKKLAKEIPFYLTRHSAKPGITGWAQVRYPYGASVEDAKEKLQYDLYYAKNHTLFLDLIILLNTAQVVLFGQGAR